MFPPGRWPARRVRALALMAFLMPACGAPGLSHLWPTIVAAQSELSRLGALGVQPNLELARQWYARARDLGATIAAERLARLPR